MAKIKIAVAGCLGRMGQEISKQILQNKNLEFVGGFEHKKHKDINKPLNKVSSIHSAKLVTATEIDNETREEVLDFIKKKGHKNVDLEEKIDKSIIGGAIIHIGNKQIDASVSNKINEMKQNFSVNLYEQNYLNKQIWEK